MKSVLLNTYDTIGGAARAAFRLNKGLQGVGVDSSMLVQFKSSDDPNVIGPVSKLGKGFSLVRPTLDSFPLRLYPKREQIIFSPAILPERMFAKVAALNPDIIHLHWVTAGFLRIETLKHFNKNLVWTLHDSWAFTGGCHIPFDCTRYREFCGRCPTLGSKKDRDLSHRVWNRKKKAWKDLNLTIIAPSHWLAECAKSSSLFRDYRVEVIPNGLDLKRYRPMDKHIVRESLSLPQDKKLVLFGAMNSTGDRNKGFHLLVPALQELAKNGWADRAELIVFGSSEPLNSPDLGLKAHYIGYLHDDISQAMLYSAADMFVLPSIQENLSNTVMEALSCGTPCVAFNIGGMPDMIQHELTGYLARPFETEDLSKGISWVLEDDKRWQVLSQQARQKVEKEFDIRLVAQRYLNLYNKILG